jgi:hypothetical protein
MPDHPASDPAKPGSKLSSIQKLGRRGGIREGSGEAPEAVGADLAGEEMDPVAGGNPSPRTPVKRVKTATRKAAKKTVQRAKTVLKKAEGKAKVKRVKKPGPPTQVGEPWKALGISKATWHRKRKAGEL